jgi:uncharacterized protein (TIGR02466 family)
MEKPVGRLQGLFPIPIGMYDLGRDFTTEELNYIVNAEKAKNMDNLRSANEHILETPALYDIKEFLTLCMNDYFMNVYKPKYNVNLRITQSWCNYTENNESHHKHQHPNSLISGVFYIQTNNLTDRIYFYKDDYKQFDIPASDFNLYNSSSWWYESITGQLLLFPSSLTHMVETRMQSDNTRISLSFNTFPVGNLGEVDQLTKLTL